MADIVQQSNSPNNCGHFIVTINGRTLHLYQDPRPLNDDEIVQLYELMLRHKGVPLKQMVNRVLIGDEATNVKQHILIAPGVAVVKTNIGMAYVNILPEANGGRALVEFEGATEFRIIMNALLPGSGSYQVKFVRDDNELAILFESPLLPAGAGEQELDTGWQPLPEGAGTQELMRPMARATNATNDPTFRRCVLLTR